MSLVVRTHDTRRQLPFLSPLAHPEYPEWVWSLPRPQVLLFELENGSRDETY